jgi:hypothetical protein
MSVLANLTGNPTGAQRRQAVPAWIESVARVGYTTKGAVYILVGGLAAAAAIHAGGEATDSEGALATLVRQPFGTVLMAAAGAGLAGYAAWRFAQGIFDAEGKGSDMKGLAVRIGYGASGLVHAGLAWTAVRLALGWPRDDGDHWRDGTARLLSLPFGRWLVGGVGLAVIGFGLVQFYKSYSQRFRRQLKREEMTERQCTVACRSAQLGLAARGVVFVIIGGFFLNAGLRHDPEEAGGLAEALHTLEGQPYGPALLGITALGLMAYGLFMFVEARFHRIRAK